MLVTSLFQVNGSESVKIVGRPEATSVKKEPLRDKSPQQD